MFIRSLIRAAVAAAITAAGAANAADDALGREAVDIFAGYLRVDTTNPPGNEIRAADFFAKLLAREGIQSTIIESAPGRANIVARLKGDGSKKAATSCPSVATAPTSSPRSKRERPARWCRPRCSSSMSPNALRS